MTTLGTMWVIDVEKIKKKFGLIYVKQTKKQIE